MLHTCQSLPEILLVPAMTKYLVHPHMPTLTHTHPLNHVFSDPQQSRSLQDQPWSAQPALCCQAPHTEE